MLLMKQRFIQLIKAGKKRQTIRLWTHARVHTGQRAYIPHLGYVRILAVDLLPSLQALTRQDAIDDGFSTRRAMLAEIAHLYGTQAGRNIYRVRFQWPSVAPRKAASRMKVPRTRIPSRTRAQRLLRDYVLRRAPV